MAAAAFEFTTLIIPAAISAMLSGVMLYLVPGRFPLLRRRSVRIFRVVMLSVAFWSIGNVIETSAISIEGKLLGVCIAYPGIVLLPVAWFFWVCNYTRRFEFLFPRWWVLLTVLPIVSIMGAWSFPFHSLMWIEPTLVIVDDFTSWRSDRGMLWTLQMLYSYSLLLLSLVVISVEMKQEPWSRVQLSMMGLAAIIPLTFSLLFATGVTRELWPVDLTPAFFAVTLVWLLVVLGDPIRRLIPGSRKFVVERLSSPIFIRDVTNQIIYRNPAAERLEQMDAVWYFSDEGEAESLEVHSGNTKLNFESRTIPVMDGETVIGSVDLLSDRTEEMDIEFALQASNEALLSRTEDLAQSASGKTRFLANISHELRSPLSSIVGFAELLKDGLVDDLTEEEMVISESVHLLGTGLLHQINQMLDFEKAESGALALIPERIDSALLLEQLESAAADMFRSSVLEFDLKKSCLVDEMTLDVKKARQIFMSTMAFVFATSPADAKLYINLTADDEGLSFNLAQRGQGVRPPDARMLRSPFVEGSASHTLRATREQRLGIALVHRLIELHHGTFLVSQRAVDWVSYRVRLPELSLEAVA